MGFDGRLKQWILQLRASPACRMTWGWGERLGQKNQFIKMCSYKRHKMNCLCSLSKTWINQKSIYLASIQSRYIEHQSNTNAHNINPKSMLIATDFFLVGFPSLKTFTLRSMPLTCHSAGNRRRSHRIHQHRGIKYFWDSTLRKNRGYGF